MTRRIDLARLDRDARRVVGIEPAMRGALAVLTRHVNEVLEGGGASGVTLREALVSGRWFRRRSWSDCSRNYRMTAELEVMTRTRDPDGVCVECVTPGPAISVEDVIADDWELVP